MRKKPSEEKRVSQAVSLKKSLLLKAKQYAHEHDYRSFSHLVESLIRQHIEKNSS